MQKQVYYRYLGTNGVLDTPIHIEGAFYVRRYLLTADENKVLTKDHKTFVNNTWATEEDLELWVEVDKQD